MQLSDQNSEKRWLVVVNPNAGKKRGEKDWPEISGLLAAAGIDFHHEFTSHRNHAVELTCEFISKGFRKIIVVGGDGTLNEVVNGIFRQDEVEPNDITLGMIMVGTGNDWGKMYYLKENYKDAIHIIREGNIFLQDAGVVIYQENDIEQVRYFVNSAGMGYDALVVQMTNQGKEKGRGGTMAYMSSLLRGLFRYNLAYLDIEVDGKRVYKGKVFSMSVGICKYSGGGMIQLPFAVADDGLLDVTLFKKVSKLTVIRHLKKLYSGRFTHLPFVDTYQGKTISVISAPHNPSFLETDGESLGNGPFTFHLIPRCLRVITAETRHPKSEKFLAE
jgi:YegS/Rv2252/BmrU family lipid kinase